MVKTVQEERVPSRVGEVGKKMEAAVEMQFRQSTEEATICQVGREKFLKDLAIQDAKMFSLILKKNKKKYGWFN